MKAIVSIPVHENTDVILNQIANFKFFFPEADIVLHISKSFPVQEDFEVIDGVYVNPKHLDTQWGDIIRPHLSNFQYVKSLGRQYDYFVLHSSNDMFIRKGVAKYISQYSAGFTNRHITTPNTDWWPSEFAWNDEWLNKIKNLVDQPEIIASQVEGSFYRWDYAEKMVDIILKTKPAELNISSKYPREEFFFATIANRLIPPSEVAFPYVFSEVHIYDRNFWGRRRKMDNIYTQWGRFFINKRWLGRLERAYGRYMMKHDNYAITKQIVDDIRKNNDDAIKFNRFLDDGSGNAQLYGKVETLFAVKRVIRKLDNPLRRYITNLQANEEAK